MQDKQSYITLFSLQGLWDLIKINYKIIRPKYILFWKLVYITRLVYLRKWENINYDAYLTMSKIFSINSKICRDRGD